MMSLCALFRHLVLFVDSREWGRYEPVGCVARSVVVKPRELWAPLHFLESSS